MNSKLILFLTRVLMGWVFFYAGITKVLNPNWSAAGYLGNAKTFAGLYNWFLQPEILPFTNFVNEWGLTLLGVSLIVGALVKYSGYLVDDHIIFIAVLLCFVVIKAGEYWGFDGWWKSRR